MPPLLRNGLHLAAISSFAIAWQYFQPLADGPDFFVERGATSGDVLLFAFGLVLVPPLVMLAAEWLAGLVSERLRDALHLIFIGGLVGLVVWQALTEAEVAWSIKTLDAVVVLAGVAAAALYARAQLVRSWLTVLSFSPVLVLALFLVFSPLRALAFGGDGADPQRAASNGAPVVMVVLDELPTVSLMDRRGSIDEQRYPGFAALGRDATWYRNAATVGDYTQIAVPSILTGRPVEPGALQVAAEHPRNLFTLLGGSHRLDVSEALTDLCAQPACPVQRVEPFERRMRRIASDAVRDVPALPLSLRTRLADSLRPSGSTASERPRPAQGESVRRLMYATQDVRFERFLQTIVPAREPTLNFLHLLLPHRPWLYEPSGRKYRSLRQVSVSPFGRWPRDPRAAALGWQRHLLQVEYVDRLIGRLVAHLKRIGLYDRALVVVTADHGAAFRPGDHSRVVTEGNVAEIASVPLFVKVPRQRRGAVDDAYVESVDVLPTIAEELDVKVPWPVAGLAAGELDGRSRPLTIHRELGDGSVTIRRARLARERDAAVASRHATLGARDPLNAGPAPELIGRPLGSVRRAPGRFTAVLDDKRRYVNVRAHLLPLDVSGAVLSERPRTRPIAVAVNGRIRATGWTLVRGGEEFFTVVVPPRAFRPGRNRIEVVPIPVR